MNSLTLSHPKLNNGKKTKIFIPASAGTIKEQIHEIFVEEHYKKGQVKKNMTIIDCGANIGSTCLYFKDYAKVIYALEPSPQNYECLVANTKDYTNIKTFNIGLAAKTAQETLHSGGDYEVAESLFAEGPIHQEVSLYSIKDFMDEQKIDHVDLLKMDTEGAEYVIFPSDGFEKVAHKIDYIIGEAHHIGGLIPDYIPPILKDCGFETEFLPIDNLFITMSFTDKIKKEYKLQKQTIFFSWREK